MIIIPFKTPLSAILGFIILNVALAKGDALSEHELQQWGQLFIPGLYQVEEYSVDKNLQPIAKTIKRQQYCFSKDELEQVSRLPFNATVLGSVNRCKLGSTHPIWQSP